MISLFSDPAWLSALTIPLAHLARVWSRQGGEVAIPVDHGVQPRGRAWARIIALFESVPALLLAVAIVLLAGPQDVGKPQRRRALSNIEFCVDISGSMTADFEGQTRYEASMQAINEFVEYRDGDAFGLTFFSDATLQWVPLTTDTSAFRYALPFMDPRRPLPNGFGGGTQIGKGLEACRKTLSERQEGDRMIILISDGSSADLYGGRASEVAANLKKDGIVVYDVHVAGGQVPEEIVTIAYETDGEVFSPGDEQALSGVFKRIDSMQKTKMQRVAAETHDQFVPFCILGLSLLSMAILGMFGFRYTPW
ncbi:MAG: vWA domain-containing protein [Planctomycetota bacterium]